MKFYKQNTKKNYDSIFTLLLLIYKNINRKLRFDIFCVVSTMILSGLADIISVAMLLPFLVILSNPNAAFDYEIIKNFAQFLNINTAESLVLPIASIFALISFLAVILKLLNLYLSGQSAANISSYWAKKSLKKILYQNYNFHMENSSNNFVVDLTTQLDQCELAIQLIFQILSGSLLILIVVITSLLIIPKVSFSAFCTVGLFYFLFSLFIKKRLFNYSNTIDKILRKRQQILSDSLKGIKQILIDSSQLFFLRLFVEQDIPRRKISQKSIFISITPRYLIEGFGLVTLAFFGVILINSENREITIAILGTFALAAQKLLPISQQIFSSWSRLKVASFSFFSILSLLNLEEQEEYLAKKNEQELKFNEFEIINSSFIYAGSQKKLFSGLNIKIFKGQKIGIFGESGSGKSTIADILMGLQKPTKGKVLVNRNNIYEKRNKALLHSWRNIISHVPQDIFIADSSFAENIAFGVPRNKIDMKKVKRAAKIAQIDHHICQKKNNYFSLVGENGSFLSGGQRQRIAIARALYKNIQVLILDEASSALDKETELKLFNDIYQIEGVTIIIISHDLSVLKKCDLIFKLKYEKLQPYSNKI